MSRLLRIGGAQMGPTHKADSRQAVVRRMLDLLDQAKAQKCDLVVYPELALTTFSPARCRPAGPLRLPLVLLWPWPGVIGARAAHTRPTR